MLLLRLWWRRRGLVGGNHIVIHHGDEVIVLHLETGSLVFVGKKLETGIGAYAIQEWIGYAGITRIDGSYFNVVGFPVQKVYEALLKLL